jgi:hypothetical protein
VAELCSSALLFSDIEAAFFFSSLQYKPLSDKFILKWKTQKNRKSVLYYAKHGVCLNSVSHRKLIRLTLRTESRSCVKNIALLVSFYKQHFCLIVFNCMCNLVCLMFVSNFVCLCVCCVWVCVTNFVCVIVCACLCVSNFFVLLCLSHFECPNVRFYLCVSLCVFRGVWVQLNISNCVCLIVWCRNSTIRRRVPELSCRATG